MRLSDISIRTILLGWLLALVLFMGLRYVFDPIWDPGIRAVILLLALLLSALAGGYFAGRSAPGNPYLHAVLIVLLDMVVLFLMGAFNPGNLVVLVLALLAGPLGVLLAQRFPFSASGTVFSPGQYSDARGRYSDSPGRRFYDSGKPSPYGDIPNAPRRASFRISNPFAGFFSRMRSKRLYDQLLRMVRMDAQTADSLISYEQRRTPYASRETLIRNAIERLQRDRRI